MGTSTRPLRLCGNGCARNDLDLHTGNCIMLVDNALSIHEPPCPVRLRALRECVVSRTGDSPFAGDNAMGNRIEVKAGDRYGLLTIVKEAVVHRQYREVKR